MAAPDRTRLPLDVDTTARPIRPVEAVAGSPNVVIVLIDDMGFGASVGVRRAVRDADRRSGWRTRGCATAGSTSRRCARRPGRR